MRALRHLLPLSFFALSLPAQQVLTAHPQDTTLDGFGNVAPFGVLPGGLVAESRVQILVPKDELPAVGAVLTGLEAASLVGDTVTYTQLSITVRPVTLTSLSTSFAANLVGTPTTVLSASGLQVPWTTGAWTPIAFTQNYVHDGVSAMLIDITKIAGPTVVSGGGGGGGSGSSSYPYVTMTSAWPERLDRPQMVYFFSAAGGGGSTSPTAFASASPVSLRLRWSGVPSLRHQSDNGTLVAYGLGNSITFTAAGNAGDLFAIAGADAFLPTAIQLPGIVGSLRIGAPILFASGLLDGNGLGVAGFVVPSVPGLVGVHLAYQAVTIDPAGGPLRLTNGTDHFVNP